MYKIILFIAAMAFATAATAQKTDKPAKDKEVVADTVTIELSADEKMMVDSYIPKYSDAQARLQKADMEFQQARAVLIREIQEYDAAYQALLRMKAIAAGCSQEKAVIRRKDTIKCIKK